MENVPPMSPRKTRISFPVNTHSTSPRHAKSARSQNSGVNLVFAARANARDTHADTSMGDLERYQSQSLSKMNATGLATPPTSQTEETNAARMLISPPPESMLRATRSSTSRASVQFSPDVPRTRSRTTSPKKPSPKKRKRQVPATDVHDDSEDVVMISDASTVGYGTGVDATPNPKQRKQPRRSLDDDIEAHPSYPNPKTPTKSRRTSSPSTVSSPSKLNLLRSPHADNLNADYVPPLPQHTHASLSALARRRSTTPQRYEPPAERFTPPREVIIPSPLKTAHRRTSTPRARPVESARKKLELVLTVKKEPPEIDLRAPLPPASPTEDPLLLHGKRRKRKSRAHQGIQSDTSYLDSAAFAGSDDASSSSAHIPSDSAPPPPTSDAPSDSRMATSSPAYKYMPPTLDLQQSTPVNAPTFDLTMDTSTITPVFRFDDVLLEANADAWSSDSEAEDAGFNHSGEFTGRFKMLTVPTKADPPSSCTRERIEAWGNPVSPFPKEARRLSALLEEPRIADNALERNLEWELGEDLAEDPPETTRDVLHTPQKFTAEEREAESPVHEQVASDGLLGPSASEATELVTPVKLALIPPIASSPAEDVELQTPVKQGEMSALPEEPSSPAQDTEAQSSPEDIRSARYRPDDSLELLSPGPAYIPGEDLVGFELDAHEDDEGVGFESDVHDEVTFESDVHDEVVGFQSDTHEDDEGVVMDEGESFDVPLNDEDEVIQDEDDEVEEFLSSDPLEPTNGDQEPHDNRMEHSGFDEDEDYEEYEEEVTIDRELSHEPEIYSDEEREYTQFERDHEDETARLGIDAEATHSSHAEPQQMQRVHKLRLDESVSTLVNEETDEASSEIEPEVAPDVVKIVADDPRAAARAAAILRMHNYDCLSQSEIESQRRSRQILDSALRNARRKSASEAGISKRTPQSRRRHTLGGLVGDKVYMPGTPLVTLPQLLQEAEASLEDIHTPSRASPLKVVEDRDPFQTPGSSSSVGSQFRTPALSSSVAVPVKYQVPHAWGKADWKCLDACFTDERLALALQRGLMFDTLADAEEVDLDEVVDRFVAQIIPQGYTLEEYGWSRDELLKRARALRRKQGTGRVAPPTPSGYSSLMSPATSGISAITRRFDSMTTSSAPRLSALRFDITNDYLNTPVPDKEPRYSQLMHEVNSVARSSSPSHSVASSSDTSATENSVPFSLAPEPEPVSKPTPSIASRVKGFFFSYLPVASKSARPIPKKTFQPAQPGLPIPPPEVFQRSRPPIETPAPKPQAKPTHPKELVHLQHVPPPKPSMIPRPSHPRNLVQLRPAPQQERPSSWVEWDAGSRRSSGGSVKELVQTFESLKERNASKSAKPTWRP